MSAKKLLLGVLGM